MLLQKSTSENLFLRSLGGPPGSRPEGDPLDNYRRDAISLLAKRKDIHDIQFAVFVCGVFFERFGPGGLKKLQLAMNSAVGPEGSYILDWPRATAKLPQSDAAGHAATISLTSIRDGAVFVVPALSKSTWPRDFRLRAEQMDMRELLATSNGHWSFFTSEVGGVEFWPERFKDYLRRAWAGVKWTHRIDLCPDGSDTEMLPKSLPLIYSPHRENLAGRWSIA